MGANHTTLDEKMKIVYNSIMKIGSPQRADSIERPRQSRDIGTLSTCFPLSTTRGEGALGTSATLLCRGGEVGPATVQRHLSIKQFTLEPLY